MSVIATAVRHLMAAGVTGEALLTAIAELEASLPGDPVANKRRAYDRERKRASKAANSTGIPPESAENAESAEAAPSLDKSPQTPKINPTPGVGVCVAPTRKGNFPCPEGCDADDWRDLLANRKSKRMGMTPSIYRKLLRDLAEQSDDDWPPGRILRHAAERGWAAIFDPRGRDGQNGQGRTIGMGGFGQQRSSGSRTVEGALAFIADGEPH